MQDRGLSPSFFLIENLAVCLQSEKPKPKQSAMETKLLKCPCCESEEFYLSFYDGHHLICSHCGNDEKLEETAYYFLAGHLLDCGSPPVFTLDWKWSLDFLIFKPRPQEMI